MNNLARREFHFHKAVLIPVQEREDIWFTSSDLAKALGYSSTKSITNLYAGNSQEFTEAMTMVIGVMTNGINNNLREKKVRIFSLRGAHLIAMFARTPVAKEFRKWVLDILDREVEQSPIAKQFTDEELCDLAWLWRASSVMMNACNEIYPLLRVAEHRMAGHFYSITHEYPRTLDKAREIIKREVEHFEYQPWKDDNWSRLLPYLRQERLQ
ncbi:P22AR C-terminal domain-containing protein [Cronobacter malonaticus]|uniref:P22AR C-terminal domain-containing protein n=1 Tax=Cronobacter malonaticus TaxID=413503 RepID=UPI0039C15D41